MTSALVTHYDNTPFWILAGTNKDDLESSIQLKVRMLHGLLADSVDTSLASLLYTLCLKKRDPDIIDCNFKKD